MPAARDSCRPAAPDAARATTTATTRIFGDLGNDWLVGGTGRDDLYGGCGNDLLNADDDLADQRRPQRPARHAPDLRGPRLRRRRARRADRQHRRRPPDRLGRRVQHLPGAVRAVRHGDRQPHAAAAAGRVPLRAVRERRRRPDARRRHRQPTAVRNGEPEGELGVVRQKDFDWHDQTGGPADPQAGNIPGGKRDVLRTADFNDGTLQGFAVDSGAWHGRRAARCRSRPTSLARRRGRGLQRRRRTCPTYFEVQASISVDQADRAAGRPTPTSSSTTRARRTSSSPASTSRPTSS